MPLPTKPRLVPTHWMPALPSKPEGIVVHWTAGAHEASSLDREHYHIMVEGDGDLVRGEHNILDNWNTNDHDYAAHTRRCNTRWIGISLCCMAGARQSPFNPGPFPMTLLQWKRSMLVAADLCERYDVPVKDTVVLAHGEVQEKLHRPQAGKWDPCKLPWAPKMTGEQVMDEFRTGVRDALNRKTVDDGQRPILIMVDGVPIDLIPGDDDGYYKDGTTWLPRRATAAQFGWDMIQYDEDSVKLQKGSKTVEVPSVLRGDDRGYFRSRDFCTATGLPTPKYDAKDATLYLKTK